MPERLQIDDIPVPEHEVTLAEPTQIEGRENPGYRQAVATAVERMKAHQLDKVAPPSATIFCMVICREASLMRKAFHRRNIGGFGDAPETEFPGGRSQGCPPRVGR